jgi:hypothetical protein
MNADAINNAVARPRAPSPLAGEGVAEGDG